MEKLKVGMFGINGHQIHELLADNDRARCAAVAEIDKSLLPEAIQKDDSVKYYKTFDEMAADEDIDLISLCSPVRKDQEEQAIKALKAGKHVYSEKPGAFTDAKLDEIIAVAKENNVTFHDMAGTCFEEPFLSMREIVDSGILGEIVQVYAQKSYPYHERRPQDDITDGGLIRWVGVHATRFIEHTTGIRIDRIYSVETSHANPVKGGGMATAASVMMTLENGAVGSMCINYLNHKTVGTWGNEHLRIWGTEGWIEATDGMQRTHMYLRDRDAGPIELKYPEAEAEKSYFEFILDNIIDKKPMPLSLEDELHPLRAVIRAKENVIEKVK